MLRGPPDLPPIEDTEDSDIESIRSVTSESTASQSSSGRQDTTIDTDEEDVTSDSETDRPRPRPRRVGARIGHRMQLYPLRRERVARLQGRPQVDTTSPIQVLQLANEVEALRRRRDEMMALHVSRFLNSGRRDFLVTTALEYYDTFSDGFLQQRIPGILQYVNSRIDQNNFTYGASALSMDAWIEQWHRYMRMFPSIAIRVRATNVTHLLDPLMVSDPLATTCMVEARGTMTGVISRQAIDTLLPHLRHREDLVHKLLGKPLNCPITLRFYFNGAGRIIRLDSDADFFQAFNNLANVGLFEVVHMMEHATIRDSSLVPEVVECLDNGEGNTSP